MSITTKLINSTARLTSQGRQVVNVYSARETGGTVLASVSDASSLLRVVNLNRDSGPPIPDVGDPRTFDLGGDEYDMVCQEVIPRLNSCSFATFQCRFSNFRYWSGPGTPVNPDPRVVSIRPSGLIMDGPDAVFAPRFVKSSLQPEGGGVTTDVWVESDPLPLRIRREFLTVRCYYAAGISDATYGAINDQIGYLHTFSNTNWEFLGASAREEAGGFTSGDPVFLYYQWQTERSNGPLFTTDSNVFSLPERESFERYVVLGYDNDNDPIIESRIPEALDYLNPTLPFGYQNFPDPKPIL